MRIRKTIIFSLILILLFSSSAFAELITYDPITGEVQDVSGGSEGSSKVTKYQLSPTSYYDIEARNFSYYSSSSWSNGYITSNVCSGEYIADDVKLTVHNDLEIEVFRNGDALELSNPMMLDDPGAYLVKDASSGKTLLEFVILGRVDSSVFSYQLPSIYFLSSYSIDGKEQRISSNNVDMSADGKYVISYYNNADKRSKGLEFTVDHTAPVLEIFGVENGEAHQAVSFGELEDGSTLTINLDGELSDVKAEYVKAGEYDVTYTDEAGNSSVYNFTIYTFLDLKAWVVIAFIGMLAIALVVYMLYWRRHMPRS